MLGRVENRKLSLPVCIGFVHLNSLASLSLDWLGILGLCSGETLVGWLAGALWWLFLLSPPPQEPFEEEAFRGELTPPEQSPLRRKSTEVVRLPVCIGFVYLNIPVPLSLDWLGLSGVCSDETRV